MKQYLVQLGPRFLNCDMPTFMTFHTSVSEGVYIKDRLQSKSFPTLLTSVISMKDFSTDMNGFLSEVNHGTD